MGDNGRAHVLRGAVLPLLGALLSLAVLQLGRWAFETLAFCAVPHTVLANELVRMVSLALVGVAVLLAARGRGMRVPLLPRDAEGRVRLGWGYCAAIALWAGLLVATPFLTGQAGDAVAWAALLEMALVTPLVEEALFRGLLWARLKAVLGEGLPLLVATSLLFGLWHLGYADAVAWQLGAQAIGPAPVEEGLGAIMAAKALFGALVGFVLGVLRLRRGCCLAPGLLHGIWNTLA